MYFQSQKWLRWAKVGATLSAAILLNTCAPLPSLYHQIKTLGELKVVTRESPLSFYYEPDGKPAGPEYELARRFADELGVKLSITAVHSYGEIYAALAQGHAHLAAAALKVPSDDVPDVVFGPAYQRVREHLVYLRGAPRPNTLTDVGNHDLEIPAGSAQAITLKSARSSIPELVWVENANADNNPLLDRVADGAIDYTIADSTEFYLAHERHPDLRVAFDFPGSRSVAWAVSDRDPAFLSEVYDYFARLHRSGELASIVGHYYGRSEPFEFASESVFMQHVQNRLPLYRQWFEEAAEKSSQDWRLLAAIGYQESKWNPRAVSAAGALGLMQLTLESAGAVKITDPSDPHQNILGGARYFQRIYEKIPAHVTEPDRTWFALAAYNIGYGHLEDARVLTQKAGRDPDSWQDVREFLPLLAEEYWYSQTANGYARGSEPVRYVENVRSYRDLLEWAWSGPRTPADKVALN
jgi:membrane-bound lytic murein transglycosylase F